MKRKRNRKFSPLLVDPETQCWLATAGSIYGTVGKEKRLAHRVYYERLIGRPIPDGLQLDHLCRRPRCVNPDHLEPVPSYVNTQRSRTAKLTPEKVKEIRLKPDKGVSGIELAQQYGVSRATVSQVITRHSWVNIT